nr:MAG TPA: hypothetical protein [Caudoviricetes sp.]DAW52270.1 MAG TPA: hypothetical protein [Caudoviricetes sp.]
MSLSLLPTIIIIKSIAKTSLCFYNSPCLS